jgi:hypothetical protein
MKRWRLLLGAVTLLAVSGIASAATFWDDFEAYAAGSAMHGQGGWKGWGNAPAAGAPLSGKYAFSGKNSVEIGPNSDLVHQFTCSGGRWIISAMQYIPSGTAGNQFFILMNIYNDAGSGLVWSVQMRFTLDTGEIQAQDGDGTSRGSSRIIYDEWVEVKCVIDLVNNRVDYYYAGEKFGSYAWTTGTSMTFQAIDLYDDASASAIYYDDVKLEQYYVYEATTPTPADGATGVAAPLFKWVAGDSAMFHNVYLSTSPTLTEADQIGTNLFMALHYYPLGFEPGVTYYWRVDEIEASGTVHPGPVWSFTAAPLTAYAPSPWDGAKGVDPQAPQLSWINNLTAQSCDVYFGASRDDVLNGTGDTFKTNQLGTGYTLGVLEENSTYYWRVDQVAADGSKLAGPVWSFTTIGPDDGVQAQYFAGIDAAGMMVLSQIEPGIDHSWGEGIVAAQLNDNVSARWTGILEPPFTETYTLTTTTDDGVRLWLDGRRIIDNWTDHAPTDNPAQVKLIAGQPYLVVMEWYEKGGGATARLSWESPSIDRQTIPAGPFQLPLRATAPYPAHATVDAPQALTLLWTAAGNAAKHEVYFGEDQEAVANGTTPAARLNRNENSFTPDTLEWGKTYFWRVDEVNDANAASPWKGAVWSFTTANFLVVDDFDSYNDEEEKGTRIYETWIDGWGDGSSGSLVGYTQRPFAEQVIVQSGKQSMPMDYNNVNAPYFSEARREYSVAQDWTVNGMDTLALFVRGRIANKTGQPLYLSLEDKAGKVGTVVHPDTEILKSTSWVEWEIPLSQFGVNAAAVTKIVIGVGDKDQPAPGGTGTVYVDSIRVIQAEQ